MAAAHSIDYDQAPMPELLRAVRQAMGWTQAQLAARLGVPELTVTYWETGRRHVALPGVMRIALRAIASRRLRHCNIS